MRTESRSKLRRYGVALWLLVAPWAVGATDLHVVVRDMAAQPVADAVVVAVPEHGAAVAPATGNPIRVVAMDQIDKQFNPFVLAVAAGSDVDFPNHDQVHHHVYSFSPTKRFELPLYGSSQKNAVHFDQPGIVVLGCNIHDWMIGYIYVAETPYFAKTGADGTATLSDLPSGNYAVRIWHPRMKEPEHASERSVEVGVSAAAEQTWQVALAPAPPQRRSPLPGAHGY